MKIVLMSFSLRLATVRYPIRVINNTVTLRDTIFADEPLAFTTFESYQRSVQSSNGGAIETLGGFLLVLDERYSSNLTVLHSGGIGFQISYGSGDVSLKGRRTIEDYFRTNCKGVPEKPGSIPCWSDPTDSALADLRELMFRLAINYANASEPMQMVEMINTRPRQIYITNTLYMSFGVSVIILGLLGVLPLLWGAWKLRGQASWNPLKVVDRVIELRQDTLSDDTLMGSKGKTEEIIYPSTIVREDSENREYGNYINTGEMVLGMLGPTAYHRGIYHAAPTDDR